ncbi:helix-turn-helix domain-containing protein [Leucobacter viscericola]|uniref:helix-turn-helix domain-containing protein n=1 Tax=Leucobacter viscericola TaxID=2714935 RepID=UPI003CC6F80E
MEINTKRNQVAGEVRAEIARQGKRQSDICRATGFSSSRLSNKLRGEAPMTVDELFIIAEALGVSVRSFIPSANEEQRRAAA